ncbi:MAG: hypothetical protein KGD64_11130 [Candidatus Heimdallarchaeota archaeon]|nr:hypothetical protein [Candidatus Heimdallarchaeota archaeon]
MKVDLNILSHVALDDKIFFTENDEKQIKNQLGGPVSYASIVFPILSVNGRCITTFGKDIPEKYLEYFSNIKNCSFEYEYSAKTTRFLHKIYPKSRLLYLLDQANNMDEFIRKFQGGKGCLVSPIYHEFTLNAVDWARKEHDYLGVDVQGFMRGLDSENKIIPLYNPKFISDLTKEADIVKFSLKEASHFTQSKSYTEILEKLPSHCTQVVTLGEKGLLFSQKEKFYKLTALNKIERDSTGAGDVLMTGIIAKMIETDDLEKSIAFGMALAAEKVEMAEFHSLPIKNYDKSAEEILNTLEKIN